MTLVHAGRPLTLAQVAALRQLDSGGAECLLCRTGYGPLGGPWIRRATAQALVLRGYAILEGPVLRLTEHGRYVALNL